MQETAQCRQSHLTPPLLSPGRVVSQVRGAAPATVGVARGGAEGVFATAEEAITAAAHAQKAFAQRGLSDRRAAIETIRSICRDQAEPLGREEFEETRIGRLEHKIDKLRVVANRIPGVEWLTTRAFSGEDGIALEELNRQLETLDKLGL